MDLPLIAAKSAVVTEPATTPLTPKRNRRCALLDTIAEPGSPRSSRANSSSLERCGADGSGPESVEAAPARLQLSGVVG